MGVWLDSRPIVATPNKAIDLQCRPSTHPDTAAQNSIDGLFNETRI